jgi:hypothetical protein
MARKGKGKVPETSATIPLAVLDAVLDELKEPATAPTELCNEHVPGGDFDSLHCKRCGKPLVVEYAGPEEPTPPEPIAASEWKDGGEPAFHGTIIGIETLWYERLVQLAKGADMHPPQYAEMLIKRAWIASGGTKRGGAAGQ